MRVQLNRYMPARAFRSRQAFLEEAERQVQLFDRLRNSDPTAHQRWGSTLQSWWQHAFQVARDANIPDDDVSGRIAVAPCIPFDSPIVEKLSWLTQQRMDQRAEGAVAYLDPRQDGNNNNAGRQAGAADIAAVIAVSERLGATSTKRMLAELLDEHEQRLDPLLEQDAEELEAKREEFNAAKAEMEEALEGLRSQASDFMTQSKADWEKSYNDFINQLKTETAVELWQKRSTFHEGRYKRFRLATGLSAVLGGLAAYAWIFEGFHYAIEAFPNSETGQIAAYSAGSILLFTLLIWTLRVLVRSMISEDHLATDASARSAMAHTYLALSKVERASDDDRAIVLAALFAPVSDGLVKDDGMPVLSPTAIAAAAITNPKSG